MTWRALVLAGQRGADDPVAQAAGVRYKAFAPIGGRPMIAYVLDALEAVPAIGDIAVAIAPDAPALADDLIRLPVSTSPAKSALMGFDQLGPPLILTTADHPLLSPAMIEDFLVAARASGADAVAAICLRETVEKAGNPARRTYLSLRDGAISGCNLFALMTPAARHAVRFWQEIEAERKKPWRMARKIGLGTLLRYATGRLGRDAVARALSRAAGCRMAFVCLDHPHAAHDVDKADDMAFARERLSRCADTGV